MKRYDLPRGYCCKPDIESVDGKWVRFDDVEPLIKALIDCVEALHGDEDPADAINVARAALEKVGES